MKINKLIKRFSLLTISFFCLTATHVAAENFVEVKNESKKFAVATIVLGGDYLAFSECLRRNESTKFNLDEVGVPFGEEYDVRFQLDYDCDALKKKTSLSMEGYCLKRKHGEVVTKGKFPVKHKRTTSTGTRNYVIRDKDKKVRCALK